MQRYLRVLFLGLPRPDAYNYLGLVNELRTSLSKDDWDRFNRVAFRATTIKLISMPIGIVAGMYAPIPQNLIHPIVLRATIGFFTYRALTVPSNIKIFEISKELCMAYNLENKYKIMLKKEEAKKEVKDS